VAKARILVVENEAIVSLIEAHALRARGYIVDVAATGEEGIALSEKGEGYDVVITDVELGEGIDGEETARRLLEKNCSTSIIFLSTRGRIDTSRHVQGVSRYCLVRKSADNAGLLEAVELSLESRRAGELFRRLERSIDTIGRLEARAAPGNSDEPIGVLRYSGGEYITLSEGAMRIFGLDSARAALDTIDRLIVSDNKAGLSSLLDKAIGTLGHYQRAMTILPVNESHTREVSAIFAYDERQGAIVVLIKGRA
jgi:CheY-like chemotaxis protein